LNFFGFKRPDGKVGVRNHVVILPTVACSSEVCNTIAQRVKGVVSLPHPHGCGQLAHDAEQTARTLIGMGRNPNVAAVLVIGLGCEVVDPSRIASKIGESKKLVKSLVIQEVGGPKKR
jgi:altronate dehydratase large subunit